MKNNKTILFLCPYPQNCAPSQRLKFEQYYPYIKQAGYKLTVSSFISEKFWNILYEKGFWLQKFWFTLSGYIKRFLVLFTLRKYDIVYIHLWVSPFGPPVFEWITRKLARKIIYDIDDMVFLGHVSDANSRILAIKGKKKILYLIKHSDYVITGAPAIEQYALKINNKVTDIPPTIDISKFPAKKTYSIHKEIVLGYSGSHSTMKYLKAIEPVFEKLLTLNIPFKVLVITNSPFSFNNSSIPLEVQQWNYQNEVELLQKMDVGLFPLTNELWVYGKRGGKALLYMAVGLPIIATAIGPNLDTFKNGENAILVGVDNIEQWVDTIVTLYQNQEIREKLGKNARITLEQRFSTETNKEIYLSIINELA